MNWPPLCGMIVSSKLATFHELATIYGVKDVFDFAELICVDAHNHDTVNNASKK